MWRPAAMAFVATTIATGASAETLEGLALARGGDVIEIQGQEVRLMGIDAPEGAQTCWDAVSQPWPCGEKAMLALSEKIGARNVVCEGLRRDRVGRLIAVCRIGDENLNAWLVGAGWALAYRGQSLAYVGAEDAARDAANGLWAGAFVPPWIWRTKNSNGTSE